MTRIKNSTRFFLTAICVFSILAIVVFASCSSKSNSFEITNFSALTNDEFKNDSSIVTLNANLTDATLSGIRIPTENQCKGGKIRLDFSIKKKSGSANEKLFYKLYFQNSTYKFDESHEYSGENFYGSWVETNETFKPLPNFENEISVTDSIVIIGNPRNEQLYFGKNPLIDVIDDQILKNTIAYIKDDKVWYPQIIEKAKKERRTIEEQLNLDASWAVKQSRVNQQTSNNRHWRNPRMGNYEFMLVVLTESQLNNLPYHQKYLDRPDIEGKFVNPFTFFKHGKGKKMNDVAIKVADKQLKVSAKFDLGSGIYVDKNENQNLNKTFFSSRCGDAPELYKKAQFQQYFHYINKDFPLKNVPITEDVMDPSFTREKYHQLKASYENSNKLINTYVNSSDCPCKTVSSDSIKKQITLINPGNEEGKEFKKEHVGVHGRIGLTYGKWRAKIKFPELINKHNVWNGITNAFWLLAQETGVQWNERRDCRHPIAYIPKPMADEEASLWKTKKRDAYSEIDFEILKESQYWPMTSYPGKKDGPTENTELLDDITVTCTNWDLACHEPEKFDIGAQTNTIDDLEFVHHRWNPWYKALTTKVPAKNKEVFGSEFYYFEIEWLPTKLIWRIGPSPDKLRIVCIMDESVTAIPNNQMIPIITQEWHSQEWWPTAPFKQNFIPFPKKDIVGKIMEIVVE